MSSKTSTIKAVVLGDADDFKRAMKDVGDAAEGAGDEVKRELGEGFDAFGETAGTAEGKIIGFKDTLTGTNDVMTGLREGNVEVLAQGFADLAGAAESLWASFGKVITQTWAKITSTTADTAATGANTTATIGSRIASTAAAAASKAWAGAQWLLNAALNANPIVIVVVAIGALVAAAILAYQHIGWFRDAVDAVARFATDTLWPVLQAVGGWIGGAFVALWDAARAAIGWVIDAGRTLWSVASDTLWPILRTIGEWIGAAFVTYLDAGRTAIRWLIDGGQALWSVLTDYVWPVIRAVGEWIGSAFVTYAGLAQTALGWVRDAFGWISDKAGAVRDTVAGIWDSIVGTIGGLGGRIKTVASGMWDGIKDGFRDAINAVIGWWNNFSLSMPGIDTPFGRVGGFTVDTPNIDYLAQGGLVRGGRGGTLAMIGEGADDELVVPLHRAGGLGLGRSVVVNVHAPIGSSARDIGRELKRYLNEFDRAAP